MNSIPSNPIEGFAVEGIDAVSNRHLLGHLRELSSADCCQQVGEPVVVADIGVLVVQHRLACLLGQVPRPVDPVRVAQEHAAPTGSHGLVAVERQRR